MAGINSDSMIMEGFICPECQQDMSSIEMLQAHFELLHSNKKNKPKLSPINNYSNPGQNHNGQEDRSAISCIILTFLF